MEKPWGKLTPRGKALRWMSNHRGMTEQPAGSNTDQRRDGIRSAQLRCAGGKTYFLRAPWCGIWCWAALKAAGVQRLTPRLASVSFIEDDARARRGCFRGWTTNPRVVLRGDLAVLFGKGVHVGMVREVRRFRRQVVLDEGNTSSGNSGSQSNGGGSYRRVRPLSAVRGFALVDFPDE
jgi:hypothetical protein